MVTNTRDHFVRTLMTVLVLFLCAGIGGADAQGIPRHLASMAKDVLAGGALDETTGDPQQDAIRLRTRQVLKDAGARYWARGDVRQEGAAAAMAKALEMDITEPGQWAKLRSVLGESNRDEQIDKLRRWADDAGKPSKGLEFDRVIAKFDEARAGAAKDLVRHHAMEVGDNKDRLDLDWDPIHGDFEIRIRANETSQGAGNGFDLQMNGDVTSVLAIENDDTVLAVRPSDAAMRVRTDEDLRRLKGAIFGQWRGGNGDIWEISALGGGLQSPESAANSRDRIVALERQIERIWSDKVFRWKNTDTGEVVLQDKFKRLKEGFTFLGQDYGRADTKEEIARLQERIGELHRAGKRLPVDSYDPVRMGVPTGGEALSLRVRVTDTEGYSWTYESAVLSTGRITAKRTLRNMKDLPSSLPGKVRRQLATAWSAPEWIELEVRVEEEPRRVYMTGQRWRLHVTYDGYLNSVKRIHTPNPRNLRLERAATKVAQGAAKGVKP